MNSSELYWKKMEIYEKKTFLVETYRSALLKGSLECSSLGIFEWYSEGLKGKTLLGLKGNIKEGDKLWTKVDYTESVSVRIRLDSFNWNS